MSTNHHVFWFNQGQVSMNILNTIPRPLALMMVCLLCVMTAGCAGDGHDAISQETITTGVAQPALPSVFTPLPVPPPVAVKVLSTAMLVIYSADSFFDFDKATVKQESKDGLDQFAFDINGVDFDLITVTGHTDRIGPHQYNLDLSLRRAEAVKAYLVEAKGIDADRIVVRGVDGADPGTDPDECPGQRITERLITCLQPDRRVEVQIFGTRTP